MEISIIVPVYQSVNSITRCVESVRNQSFQFWELLLIDDGSTDQSGKICAEYAEKDARIRYFFHKNAGVGYTRNRGICEAGGRYLMFLDSDDELCEGALEKVFRSIKKYYPDVLLAGYRVNLPRKWDNRWDITIEQDKNLEIKENLYRDFFSLYKKNILHNIGTKLYKRECLIHNKILFDEKMNYWEDICFCLRALRQCTTFALSSDVIYQYNLGYNEKSLSKIYHIDMKEAFIKLNYELRNYWQEIGEDNLSELLYMSFEALVSNEITNGFTAARNTCQGVLGDGRVQKLITQYEDDYLKKEYIENGRITYRKIRKIRSRKHRKESFKSCRLYGELYSIYRKMRMFK